MQNMQTLSPRSATDDVVSPIKQLLTSPLLEFAYKTKIKMIVDALSVWLLLSCCSWTAISFLHSRGRGISPRNNHAFLRQRKTSRFHSHFLSMTDKHNYYDVAVLGSGPAGMSLAWLLQERQQCSVVLIDPRGDQPRTWYPNYGEWRDEWHALATRLDLPELNQCTTNEWEVTDCFLGDPTEGLQAAESRLRLTRPYVRVDRVKMQRLLRDRFLQHQGHIIASKVEGQRIATNLFDRGIQHRSDGSVLDLANGQQVHCKLVVDATGLESKFIQKEDPMLARGSEQELATGYQIAYGFIAHVDSLGPYDEQAMTLFDYRTSHLEHDAAWLKDGIHKPTFMYAMPLGRNADGSFRVFWEETSLVGRGDRRLSFEECKRRAYQRLKHYNIKVLGVEEEEYCYIPMGGELPDLKQRVVAFGGAANMVHPATGYQVCRMLAGSTDLAAAIGNGVKEKLAPDQIASNAYYALWNRKNRNQRDFQVYGGDFLMAQDVGMLRGFFSAFFSMEQAAWGGFLGGWPGLPGNEFHDSWEKRLCFATKMFSKMSNSMRIAMISYVIKHTAKYGPNVLFRSMAPGVLFGNGPVDNTVYNAVSQAASSPVVGDMTAKEEARKMMVQFTPSAHHDHQVPVVTSESTAASNEESHSHSATSSFVFPSPFN